MNKLFLAGTAGILMLASLGAQAAGDAAAGKTKSAACAACHSADGNSVNPDWPKLAGQHEKYTVKQLNEFKSGARENAIMAGLAAGLSDQDMADLGAYFASQPVARAETDPELVELGRSIFQGGIPKSGVTACMACHGPTGAGNGPAGFAAIAGQHAKYTAAQLMMFRNESRANDEFGMMRGASLRLTDKEINAVASYIQGLQ